MSACTHSLSCSFAFASANKEGWGRSTAEGKELFGSQLSIWPMFGVNGCLLTTQAM